METLLALAASLFWGTADYFGGSLSRRLAPILVALVSQAVALVVVALTAGLVGGFHTPGLYLGWGAASGVVGALSLAMFYRALATGTIGVVAPIAATGVVVPVLVGLLSGEHPGSLRIAGIAVAALGAVLASGPEMREAIHRRRAVGLAFASAIGFGSVYVFLAKGSITSIGMTILTQRAAGVAVLGTIALCSRRRVTVSLSDLPPLASIGVMDVGANVAFALASRLGPLAIAATLGSLYPIVTVALARILLKQRLRGIQVAGVVFVMTGVVMLTI